MIRHASEDGPVDRRVESVTVLEQYVAVVNSEEALNWRAQRLASCLSH